MTVETVETVVAAAPYSALIGHKLRPLLSDSQSALADCEENVIQMCHLLSRNGKLSLVRLTKSFPTIPNLRGIANAYQNDERFKIWSVMLLCTIATVDCCIMHGGEMTVLSTAPCAKCNACAKCKELGAQIRGWCTFSRLHLTGEFCLRISIRWRSMVRCTFSRVRIFAGTPALHVPFPNLTPLFWSFGSINAG